MICRNESSGVLFNYKFVEEGMVELSNNELEQPKLVKYEDWCNEYYIVDKWRTI